MQALAVYAESDLLLPSADKEVIRRCAIYTDFPYSDKFESLFLLYGLRRLVLERLLPELKPPSEVFDLRDLNIDKKQLREWESCLVDRWPYRSERALLEIAHRTKRVDYFNLTLKENRSPVWQATYSIDNAEYLDGGAVEKLVNKLISAVQQPLPNNAPQFFHPGRQVVEHDIRLQVVCAWWNLLNRTPRQKHTAMAS